jgi:hypothetical protein
MRSIFWVVFLGLSASACTQWFVEPYPDLLETEKKLVSACKMVGVISETADAGNPFAAAARQNMILRVRERAGMLGATHIVWLHRTATSAAAEAYRCPPPPQ